jgi:hypothetical protein
MKLAIVPALAIAAGSVALMASPAFATPEVRQAPANPALTSMAPDAKWYGGGHDEQQGDVCYINQFFPGFNILSGNVLNDAIDVSANVILQLVNVLGLQNAETENPIVNHGCP